MTHTPVYWCKLTGTGYWYQKTGQCVWPLKLNTDKTQLIWLGTRQQLAKLTLTQLQLSTLFVEFDSVVTDLGVVLDNQLSMGPQVTAVSRSCSSYQINVQNN